MGEENANEKTEISAETVRAPAAPADGESRASPAPARGCARKTAPSFTTWLGDLAPAWREYAEARGKTPGGLLADMAREILFEKRNGRPLAKMAPGAEEKRIRRGMMLTFPESEWTAFEKLAAATGLSKPELAVRLIRSCLLQAPVYSKNDMEILKGACFWQKKVAVRLDQLHRRMTSPAGGKDSRLAGLVAEAAAEVRQTSEVIGRIIRFSESRRRIEFIEEDK